MDFRGAADEVGNMYWIEYDPPPTFDKPDAPPWLVSADGDGKDRYRVPISVAGEAFLIAGDKVVTSKGAVVAAYAAASGDAAWSIDLRATYRDGYARIQGIADLGNGNLAFGMYDYNIASGLYLVDAATGKIVWSNVAGSDADDYVAGSDGVGSALVIANRSSSYSPDQGYHYAQDVFVIDSAGRQTWNHRITDGGALLAWASGAPWLSIGGTPGLSPARDYTAVPGSWFSAVEEKDSGFAIFFGATGADPDGVDVIRSGAAIAQGPIAGTNAEDGLATFPFLAGETGDHLILLSQRWHSIPALCHPSQAGAAALWRFDASSSYQCPFAFQGESAIEGAVLLEDRVILSRRTYLTDACTHELQPVTIEAYGLPGESLAPSGWVQYRGSPGLGMRPRRAR